MVTNPAFNNFQAFSEQQLYEDQIVEAIQIHGQDMWYVPRRKINKDQIYFADDVSEFDSAYLVDIYIKSIDGFQGDQSFMSRFQIEIRDQITFTIAKRTFDLDIGTLAENNFVRPREGDLIYYPLNKKCFEIKFVDNKPFFYPLGELFTYDLYCETFEYSDEKFSTGIPEIDAIQQVLSTNLYDNAIHDLDGNAILDSDGYPILPTEFEETEFDPLSDNDSIQSESDDIIDFSVSDPFSEGGRY